MKGEEFEEEQNLTFGEHLEDFRRHLLRIIAVVFLLAIVCFLAKSIVFDIIILGPLSPDFVFNRWMCSLGEQTGFYALCMQNFDFELINVQVSGQFMLHLTISFAAGFVLSFPYILFELWKFVKPALSNNEIKKARGIVFYTAILFFTGVLFGYFIIAPLAFNFFGSYVLSESLENKFLIQSYISVLWKSALSTGIAFELPLVVYFTSRLGLTTAQGMRKYRRHAIIALFIVAAILTPADPFSMILVAIPLLLLYELSIFIAKRNSQ